MLVAGAEDPVHGDSWANLYVPSPDKNIGDTVDIAPGTVVSFGATWNNIKPGWVEVLVNGLPFTPCSGFFGVGTGSSTCGIYFNASSWVTLRTQHAQTSPIYVKVNGQPIRWDPRAACRLARHVNSLILRAGDYQGIYSAAKNLYVARALDHGVPCDVDNWPQPPRPSCPGNSEGAGDHPDHFPGTQLPVSASTLRITGRLAPKPSSVRPQPFGEVTSCQSNANCTPGNVCDPALGICVDCIGNASSLCPDYDHFVIPATCVAGKDYLRGRVVLRTEASLNLEAYVVNYCWSDSAERCGIDHDEDPMTPRLVTFRTEATPVGGGMADLRNVPIDVRCQGAAGQQRFLNVWVLPGGPAGGKPAIPQCNAHPNPADCCDTYSLFYSVEATDDGFIYSNGSGAIEPVPPVDAPTNP
ncbi:MAG: hypothetical protein MJD61_05640 [Proteobacteria bacterium]|nr:hypothetical protein [Pseudomonadota bacterium]